ncbi:MULTISPECIES: nitroreductase [unclassified Sinorhizobium]|uniref:nitroreductase n=1 Tax=unclassified Sinorhizobium TaxID=2613772 RepID=UPI0024C29AA4|nr:MULTISPECIES: nitroreductase [unclassified Sinorhizobium]MDK1373771.1 nitroreductase [Sinorhizobium sp. 6-70]MDK1478728.1 nitroreductase [Sinorhizobium sp. 6-117]
MCKTQTFSLPPLNFTLCLSPTSKKTRGIEMNASLQQASLDPASAAHFVDQVMTARTAKRGFLDTPVSIELVRDILSVARYAPSSSNTQPWQCYVLVGEARERITSKAVDIFRAGPEKLQPEYPFFPQPLHEPFAARFNCFRGRLGDAVGVPRSDKYGRLKDVERQFRFFEAPVGLIFTMDRGLELASFICYGCFLQNIMLAAKARGLDTCAQQIWSLQHALLREELKFDDGQMVVAGMSLGYANNALAENNMCLEKLLVDEFTMFVEQ